MQDLVDSIPARAILDVAPFGVMLLRNGRILFVNRKLAEWFGRDQKGFEGLSPETAEPLGFALLFEDYEELVLSRGEGELRLHRWQEELPGGVGVHFFEDLTERVRLQRERDQFRELARALDTRDSETGLLNREAILDALESQVSRSRRYGNPFSVIRLNLKRVRENPAPNSLKNFGRELNAELRWADQIGRFDQTSFLLVLPETRQNDAERLAAKLGKDRAILSDSERWAVETMVSSWQAGDDSEALLERLDDNLPET